MASHGQTHDDAAGSMSAPQLQKDNALELPPADYSGTDSPIPFPFTPLQFCPLPAGYEYQQIIPDAAVHDFNMVTYVNEHGNYPMKVPVDQDVIVINDIPIQDHQVTECSSARVDTMSSGYQTPNNMMSSDHGVNSVPQLENYFGAVHRNSRCVNSVGVGNFHMNVRDAEIQNNSRQPTELDRTFTNFNDGAAIVDQNIIPRVYDNQVTVNSSQPSGLDECDGRFLSLGCHSNIASNIKSNTYGGRASHVTETSFSPQGQVANDAFNNVRGSVAGFRDNVGGQSTPWDCVGNLTTLSGGDDYHVLQAMTSGDGMSSFSNQQGGQVNMHHYIPSPRSSASESGIGTNARISSSSSSDCSVADPFMLSNSSVNNQGLAEHMKRTMQRVPFNSSILRSNHQNAADLIRNSNYSSNLIRVPDSQDKSGLTLGTVTTGSAVQGVQGHLLRRSSRLLPSGQAYPPDTGHGRRSTGETAGSATKNELPPTTVCRESPKRKLDLPPRVSTQDQRRKIMHLTSALQFSPNLLQNALGQIPRGQSTPGFTTFESSSLVPSSWTRNATSFAPAAGTIGASNTARVSQHLPSSTSAFGLPIHIPTARSASEEISLAVRSSSMSSPDSLAKTSNMPMVATERPTFASPPIHVLPTALPRTVATRSGSGRMPIPATSSKRVAAAAFSPSARTPTSVTAPRKTSLPHTSSMNRPTLNKLRKSALAALAKAVPGVRASQVSSKIADIKFEGFNIPPTIGFKCMLCKRDLSFAPEGRVEQPPIPPHVAVLPCGHTFHDHCLLLITPEDASKDPPCIPCALGEK